ncbi:hypothetical protein TrLO_g11192 [Triparma laevis f. longispina]|uniref:Uncharacterized protein n=1 Tax=Triparma laevis f. longispina TaxID=1714387 RepID=A0A9W7FE79_9STRA|nr:hypothetical protein TrLO_g11192 [Triparma laevis f. longispina]
MGCNNSKSLNENATGIECGHPLLNARSPSKIRILGIDDDERVEPLMEMTEDIMARLTGMIELKKNINRDAAEVLSKGVLGEDRFVSYTEVSEQESDARDLDELYGEAEAALPVFTESMRELVINLGMDPDSYPVVEGKRIVDGGVELKTLTVVRLKRRTRADEKVEEDYNGNFKRILDLVRCSITVETEEDLGRVLAKLMESEKVMRLKNRFMSPLPEGIRDCLLNVMITGHICEVQLHLSVIIKQKGLNHEFYNFFRKNVHSFNGKTLTESYTEVMARVEALGYIGLEKGQGERSVAWGISKLLKEGDLTRLMMLGEIVGKDKGFGDVKLNIVVRRRIVEVMENSGGDLEEDKARKLELFNAYKEMGIACGWTGDSGSQKYYKLAKEGYEELLGQDDEKVFDVSLALIMGAPAAQLQNMSNHFNCVVTSGISTEGERIKKLRDLAETMKRVLGEENEVTLKVLNALGNKLRDNGEFDEARQTHERCLAGRENLLGKEHRRTLKTAVNLGGDYVELRNNGTALEFYLRALICYKKQLGTEHKYTRKALKDIKACIRATGSMKAWAELKKEYPWIPVEE